MLLPSMAQGRIVDPLSWIETKGTALDAWLDRQDSLTNSVLPDDDGLAARIRLGLSYDAFTAPVGRGGRYFFLCSPKGAERMGLWMSRDPADPGIEIVAPSHFDHPAKGLAEIQSFWPAPDGRRVIVALIRGGRQETSLAVLSVGDDGASRLLEELATPAPAWAVWHNDQSFFWSRREKGAATLSLRRIGGDDVPISLGSPADVIVPMVSEDRSWLLVVCGTAGVPGCRLFDGHNRAAPDLVEVTGLQTDGLSLGGWSGRSFLAVTRTGDGGTQVVGIDFPAATHRVLLRDDKGVLTRVCALPEGEALLVDRAPDGGRSFRKLAGDGSVHPVAAPTGVSLGDWSPDGATGRLFVTFGQWDAPPRLLEFDPARNAFRHLRGADGRLPVVSHRIEVRADDGTAIPVTIIAPKGDRSSRPCLLWGYGGFGISISPGIMGSLTPWFEAGGMVAVAHVRGGGEGGPAWHEAGRGVRKRVSLTDFVSVTRHLSEEGWTQPDRLCLWGASAGGLLVLAAAVAAPDACAAVIADNPVADLAKFTAFEDDGKWWTVEFGDPTDPEVLARLAEWSPLHTLAVGRNYPASVIVAGGNDQRVSPSHGRKMTAALQATGRLAPICCWNAAGPATAGTRRCRKPPEPVPACSASPPGGRDSRFSPPAARRPWSARCPEPPRRPGETGRG